MNVLSNKKNKSKNEVALKTGEVDKVLEALDILSRLDAVSAKEASMLLQYRESTKAFFKDLDEAGIHYIVSEKKKIPGWKVVEGRVVRQFIDDEKAIARFLKKGVKKKDLFEKKLKSVKQLEDEIDDFDEIAGDLVGKKDGAPKLVRIEDMRDSYLS